MVLYFSQLFSNYAGLVRGETPGECPYLQIEWWLYGPSWPSCIPQAQTLTSFLPAVIWAGMLLRTAEVCSLGSAPAEGKVCENTFLTRRLQGNI